MSEDTKVSTRPLTEEEMKALSVDMEKVLKKHGVQMLPTINVSKVITKDDGEKKEDSNA